MCHNNPLLVINTKVPNKSPRNKHVKEFLVDKVEVRVLKDQIKILGSNNSRPPANKVGHFSFMYILLRFL